MPDTLVLNYRIESTLNFQELDSGSRRGSVLFIVLDKKNFNL